MAFGSRRSFFGTRSSSISTRKTRRSGGSERYTSAGHPPAGRRKRSFSVNASATSFTVEYMRICPDCDTCVLSTFHMRARCGRMCRKRRAVLPVSESR